MSSAAAAVSTPLGTAAAQVKLNELFMQWLSSVDGIENARKELSTRSPSLVSSIPWIDEEIVTPAMMTDRPALFTEIDSEILMRRRNSLFPPSAVSRNNSDVYTPSPSPSRDRMGGSGPVLSPPRSPQSSPHISSPYRTRATSPLPQGPVGAVDELDIRARRRPSPSSANGHLGSPAAVGAPGIDGSPASARRPMSPIASPASVPSRAVVQSRLLASASGSGGDRSPSASVVTSSLDSPQSGRSAAVPAPAPTGRFGGPVGSSASAERGAARGGAGSPAAGSGAGSVAGSTAGSPSTGAVAGSAASTDVVPLFYRPQGPPPSPSETDGELAALAALFPSVPATFFSTRPAPNAPLVAAAGTPAATAAPLVLGTERWQAFTRNVCGLPRLWHRAVGRRVAAFSIGASDILAHPPVPPRTVGRPPPPAGPTAQPGAYMGGYGYCSTEVAQRAAGVKEISATVARAWWWRYCNGVRRERRMFDFLRGSGSGRDKDSTGSSIVPKESCSAPKGVPLLWFADFFEILQELVELHPGLAFLESTPEFQVKYVETVAYRVFFSLARCTASWLPYHDFVRYDERLPRTFFALDDQADVNAVTDFFSYEHYYVIYCRFWEIDKDHDFVIDINDLTSYAPTCINARALERVMAGHGRPSAALRPGTMCYRDFVWFCLAEEDKAARTSVEYWFRVLDVNADGQLDLDELGWYWEGNVARIREQGCEPVKYLDVLRQMVDMVAPGGRGVTLAELQRCAFPADFLNVFVNARKFLDFEYKDPYREHSARANMPADWGEWERFARREYDRMAEEAGDGDD